MLKSCWPLDGSAGGVHQCHLAEFPDSLESGNPPSGSRKRHIISANNCQRDKCHPTNPKGKENLYRGSPQYEDFGASKKCITKHLRKWDCKRSPTNVKIPHLHVHPRYFSEYLAFIGQNCENRGPH